MVLVLLGGVCHSRRMERCGGRIGKGTMAIQMTRCRICGHMYDPTQPHDCRMQCQTCGAIYFVSQGHNCPVAAAQAQQAQMAATVHTADLDRLVKAVERIAWIITFQFVAGLLAAVFWAIAVLIAYQTGTPTPGR